jgi:hypothetical protein
MIIDKYFDQDINTFRVTAKIIELLRINNQILIEDLFSQINYIYGGNASYMLFEALGLLYLTGKVKYDPSTDMLVGIK